MRERHIEQNRKTIEWHKQKEQVRIATEKQSENEDKLLVKTLGKEGAVKQLEIQIKSIDWKIQDLDSDEAEFGTGHDSYEQEKYYDSKRKPYLIQRKLLADKLLFIKLRL